MSSEISVEALSILLQRAIGDPDPRRSALDTLDSLDPSRKFSLSEQDTAKLKFIYTRRARKAPQVAGLQEFLDSLAGYKGATLRSTYYEGADGIIYFWVNEQVTELVGCIVGGDPR